VQTQVYLLKYLFTYLFKVINSQKLQDSEYWQMFMICYWHYVFF